MVCSSSYVLHGLQAQKSQEDIMREQEAMLMAKYGGLKPKKKAGVLGGAPKVGRFFFLCASRHEQSRRDLSFIFLFFTGA